MLAGEKIKKDKKMVKLEGIICVSKLINLLTYIRT